MDIRAGDGPTDGAAEMPRRPESTVAGAGRGPAPVPPEPGGPTLSAARARVLRHLREHPDPVAVEDLAHEFEQHPNTLRNHVDALVRAGLVLRERVPGPDRGRPPWRYRINPDRREPDPRLREHQGLVVALAASLAERSPEPRAEARAAGLGWGRALVAERASRSSDAPTEATRPTPAAARHEVVRLLSDLDFSPRADRAATRVVLTTCPLLDVARQHPEVVCAVHEGMVAGALDAIGGTAPRRPSGSAPEQAPDDGVRLVPFAAREGCVLTLPGSRSGRSAHASPVVPDPGDTHPTRPVHQTRP